MLYVIEMKIIFVSFAHYILLPEPLATLAVTAGLYGGVGTLFCVLTGALRNPIVLAAIATTAGVSVRPSSNRAISHERPLHATR